MASLQDDPPANLLNDLFGRIADRDEIVHLGSPDVAPGNHCAADPVEEAVPEGTLVQDNGKRTDTFGLREHKRFGEFVNGAHAAGHDDIRERILYKHELAQEEVSVITAYFYILIAFLFVGKLDMQADGRSSGLGGSLVARFHEAGTAAGDDAITRLVQKSGDGLALAIQRLLGRDPGGTENGHARTKIAERFEPIDNFSENPKHSP